MSARSIVVLLLLTMLYPLTRSEPIDRATLRWMRDAPVIDSIVIEGNSHMSDARIRGQMYSKRRTTWGWVTGNRRSRIQRETYDRDTLEIKYLYFVNGFLGVQVKESFEVLGEDSTALVRVRVHEGNQFFYGDKEVKGEFSQQFGVRFEKIYRKLKEGDPVNPLTLRQAAFDIKTALANNGYPYAMVNYQVDTLSSPPVTPITFTVVADSLVYFGDVIIEGSDNYPEFVPRREVTIKPGDLYRRQAIVDSQRRLFESGYFSYLQLSQVQNGGDRLRPDFLLKVRERKSRFISVKTGAGQSELKDLIWDFSLGGGKRNFIGSRRVSLSADYSFSLGAESRLITHRYRTRYTEPWFLGFRMPLSLTGEYEPPIKSTLQDFTITQWAVSASTTKRFGEKVKTSLGIEYNEVEISDVPPEQEAQLKESEGIFARRRLYYTYRRDSRDNIFIPRRGSLSDFSVDYVGGFLGGDDDFYKIEGSWSRYQIVWPGWVSATRLKGGYVTAFDDSEVVPSDEALYLGGANTIRGFTENSLGPLREDGSAEGARITVIFNQEFRWKTLQILKAIPLSVFQTLPLWQSVFFDVGNGFRDNSEIALNNLAISYGAGFQIVSPAGPIRIDYARRIKTEKYDFDSRWHFTILYAF